MDVFQQFLAQGGSEDVNSYGRNTDRKSSHRAAQLAVVVAILLIISLLDAGHLPTA